MVLAIDDSSDIPIYLQIRNQIVQGISDGRLEPGEQLPAVRALAAEMGINFMTVNKAYQLLKQEGYLFTDRRNGARIRETFEQAEGLSPQSRRLLSQIISEAKIAGLSREAFLRECAQMYGSSGTEVSCPNAPDLCPADLVPHGNPSPL